MAYTPPYDPNVSPYDATHAQRYEPAHDRPHHEAAGEHRSHVREEMREVTAGPYRFGLREAILGILGLFAVLGVVLGVLGFAAAFALDNAATAVDGSGNVDAAGAAAALPALLVSALPFMAAPILALGLGAWAGHASRNGTLGALAGGVGGFLGPIIMLLITGAGFALGAGAAGLDLSNVNVQVGLAPGWGDTIPYLFTGAGLLWLLANTLSGALSGGLIGGLLDRRIGARRAERRRTYERRSMRY